MANNLNIVILHGRLAKGIELREGQNSVVARTSIAVGNKDGADFINLVAFGELANNLAKYCGKGKEIALKGHIKTGTYEKDGKKVYTTDVIIDQFDFCGSKSDSQAEPKEKEEGFMDVSSDVDSELPFR